MLRKYLLAAGIAACLAMPTYADTITTVINGRPVVLQQSPIVRGSEVLVPIGSLVENLGGTYTYDPVTRTFITTSGARTVKVDLGSTTAFIDGTPVLLTSLPVDLSGQVMVPLTFAERVLGADLTWAPASRTVTLVSEEPVGPVVINQPAVTETHLVRVENAAPIVTLPATATVDAMALNIADGQAIPDVFTLQGRTAPNATVRVTAVRDGAVVGSAANDSYALMNRARDYVTTADSSGFFEVQVDTTAIPVGSSVLLKLQSTDPLGRKGALHRMNVIRR